MESWKLVGYRPEVAKDIRVENRFLITGVITASLSERGTEAVLGELS